MRIAREGFRYIGALALLGATFLLFPPTRALAVSCFLLAGFVVFFFRDPDRSPPEDETLLVSPADGKVVYVGEGEREPAKKQISIFLSILDVHINRSPMTAEVRRVQYTPGKFLAAYNPEAGRQNEQNEIELADRGYQILLRQIAGVVARRIVCCVRENDHLGRGERFGLIQFGSRVEVVLPPDTELRVKVGDRVKGGETVIAKRP